MSKQVNSINPKGYGVPLVGLFRGSQLITYNPVNGNFKEPEAGFFVFDCSLDEDEEDGVQADVTIHSNKVNLIDSPYFLKGANISIAFGYMGDDGVKFGPRWILYLKDMKVSYGEIIAYNIKLVDELTLAKADKGDDKAHKALDQISRELEGIEDLEDEVENPKDLDQLMIRLNGMRSNLGWRNDLMYFTYQEAIEAAGTTPAFRTRNFHNLIEFREFLKTRTDKDYTDHELVQKYGKKNSGIIMLLRDLKIIRSPMYDLFGYEMGLHGEGNKEWHELLKESGALAIVQRRAREMGHPLYGALVSPLLIDSKFMDEVFQELLDQKALKFVEKDVNLSVIENLNKLKKQEPGGPHLINDLGRGDGTQVRTRNFLKSTYMELTYKGGGGDVIDMSFDTDFYSSSGMASSSAISIDGDTGIITQSEDYYLTNEGSIPRSHQDISEFLDSSVDKLIRNEELGEDNEIDIESFVNGEVKRQVILRGSTSRTDGYEGDGTSVLAIDRTAVYLNPSLRIFHAHGPSTIDRLRNEIDNRKADLDLKKITADVKIIGRPNIRSGMIFNIKGVSSLFTGRYYCISVSHNINSSNGYTTSLKLGKIIIPKPVASSVTTVGNSLDEERYKKYRDKRYVIRMPWAPISQEINRRELERLEQEKVEPVDPIDPIEELISPHDFSIAPIGEQEIDHSERFIENLDLGDIKGFETPDSINREHE